MSKLILSLMAAALVCVAATTALAGNGTIAAGTLDDMGLSALQMMSDSQAMEVRGMGYKGGDGYQGGDGYHGKKGSSAEVEGKSWASVELDGHHADDEGEAGSHNEYEAEGNYEASGANFSEATLEVTDILQVDYTDGTTAIETKTRRIHVEAGGYSSAKAF